MIEIKTSNNLRKKLHNSRLGILLSNVKVEPSSLEYDKFISKKHLEIINKLNTTREGELELIQETRSAYKVCGKEPSRYRPSAEALLRRLRTKKELYQINNVVDSINLTSSVTQFSIGGFDYQQIIDSITLDIGDSSPYEAIGRGNLNIEFMPGLRDSKGFFGTPTSDSIRTMVNNNTSELLLVFYDFYGNNKLIDGIEYAEELLKKYCSGKTIFKSVIE